MSREHQNQQVRGAELNAPGKLYLNELSHPASQQGFVLKFIKHDSIYEHASKSAQSQTDSSQKSVYNISLLKTNMLEDGQLSPDDMLELIAKFKKIIANEENMIRVNGDVIVVGDIHGQYYDFVKILSIISSKYGDMPSLLEKQHILFLGDFVDRGYYSIEVMTIVMALKVNYPSNVHCLRGNHECRTMTAIYNFKAQVLVKYNQEIYEHFMEAFDLLPFACLVNGCYFCAHGGISDKLLNISKINMINRAQQIPDDGPLCDFIWSDPVSRENESIYDEVEYNNVRMCSIFFGEELINKFQKINHVKSIIRAHQVFHEGYQRRDWNKKHPKIPSILTIFSAPNYCGIYGNYGAILHIKNNSFEIKQYKEQTLHNMSEQIDMISWSLPEILRVLNEFAKNMMQTLEKHYLKNFSDYSELSFNSKLNILLEYFQKYHKRHDYIQNGQLSLENAQKNNDIEHEESKIRPISRENRPKSPKEQTHQKIEKLNSEYLRLELQRLSATKSHKIEKHNSLS